MDTVQFDANVTEELGGGMTLKLDVALQSARELLSGQQPALVQ